MIIAIGDVEVPTVGGTGPSDNPDPMSPSDLGRELIIIIPPIKTLHASRSFTACIMLKPFIMHA